VLEVLERHYVEARLHTDGDKGDELTAFEQEFANSIATPLYFLVDPRDERVLAGPLTGLLDVEDFRAVLQKTYDAERTEEKVGRLPGR
jgi:hypothetical protein